MYITEIAESLLGRKLSTKDGISHKSIEKAEVELNIKFPEGIKNYWLTVGNIDLFNISFNEFYELDELELTGSYLPFIIENQGACEWAFNVDDKNSNPKIYQSADYDSDTPTWYEEDVTLDEFITIMLYFQCAEGGYEFGGDTNNVDAIETILKEVESTWKKVVEHNGLVIYQNNQVLIWYLLENGRIDTILCSALTEDDYKNIERKFNLSEL